MLGIFMGLGDTLVNKTGTKSQKKNQLWSLYSSSYMNIINEQRIY